MNSTISNTPPFSLADLTVLEDHEISVYPENQHWLAAMRDLQAKDSKITSPAEKVMQCLVELSDGNWGIKLPRKCCLYVGEAQDIKLQSSARDTAVAAYLRLVQKIARKLKLPREKVQQMLSRTFDHLDKLEPWLEEITAATQKLQSTDTRVATVTVIVQNRLLGTWTEYDTISLPESFFNAFLNYADQEKLAWKVPEVEGEFYEEDFQPLDAEIEDVTNEEQKVDADEVKKIEPATKKKKS